MAYGFNPIAPLDLLPLLLQEHANMEASKHAEVIQLHLTTKEAIEKKAEKAKKHRKKLNFQLGDLVWVHLRKERFLEKRKSKLLPHGDGPFRVLKRINDNAYKIDLPVDYAVSSSFNVADLSPFIGSEDTDSRTNPFQVGEDDEDIPSCCDNDQLTVTTEQVMNNNQDRLHVGPMTRARARQIQQQVNLFLHDCIAVNESFILPNVSMFLVLRYTCEAYDRDDDQVLLHSFAC